MVDLKSNPARILVIQLARFGDFLQTTPLLSALRAQNPKARISVLVDKGRTELAEKNPDIDEVLSVDLARLAGMARSEITLSEKIESIQAAVKSLKTERYGLVINLNYSRVAALLANLIDAEKNTGPRYGSDRKQLTPSPWAGFILNLMTNRRLIRFNLVDLLTVYAEGEIKPSGSLAYPLSPEDLRLGAELLTQQEGQILIGFQLGSRHFSRQWPLENFTQLGAQLMTKRKARLVLLGTGEEERLGRIFMESLKKISPNSGERVINLMGRTTIPALAGVLNRLNLLVTTDTGSMHLAAAVKTPILALFIGPAFCHETGPYGTGHVLAQTMTECGPCQESETKCEDAFCRYLITPKLIFSLAEWILSERESPLPSADDFGPDVRLLISSLDDFGTVYRPLAPWRLTREDVLAASYREAGRAFMRSGYRLKEEKIASELSSFTDPGGLCFRDLEVSLEHIIQFIPPNSSHGTPAGLKDSAEGQEELKPLIGTVFNPALEFKVRLKLAQDMLRVITVAREIITGQEALTF